jgi:hypothetical protein
MKKIARHRRGIALVLVFALLATFYTTIKIVDHEPFAKSSTLYTYDGKICTYSKTGFPFTVITSVTEEPCSYSTIPPENVAGVEAGVNTYFNYFGLLANFVVSGLVFTVFYLLACRGAQKSQ